MSTPPELGKLRETYDKVPAVCAGDLGLSGTKRREKYMDDCVERYPWLPRNHGVSPGPEWDQRYRDYTRTGKERARCEDEYSVLKSSASDNSGGHYQLGEQSHRSTELGIKYANQRALHHLGPPETGRSSTDESLVSPYLHVRNLHHKKLGQAIDEAKDSHDRTLSHRNRVRTDSPSYRQMMEEREREQDREREREYRKRGWDEKESGYRKRRRDEREWDECDEWYE